MLLRLNRLSLSPQLGPSPAQRPVRSSSKGFRTLSRAAVARSAACLTQLVVVFLVKRLLVAMFRV